METTFTKLHYRVWQQRLKALPNSARGSVYRPGIRVERHPRQAENLE